jgi:hypothetical protein
MPMIASALNRRGIVSETGGLWTRSQISGVLTNPKYMGANITNRKSLKLKTRAVNNPPDMWVRREGAFPALVSCQVFAQAQKVLAAHNRRYTDDELLELLNRLLSRVGKLSTEIIDKEGGMPCSKVYQVRFKGLLEAYRRIGYKPEQNYAYVPMAGAVQAMHKERIAALVSDFESMGAIVFRDPLTDLITINHEIRVRFLSAFCYRYGKTDHRWIFSLGSSQPYDIAIVARLGPQNDLVLDYFLVPRLEGLRDQSYRDYPTHVLNIYRFRDLSVLKTLFSRTELKEAI